MTEIENLLNLPLKIYVLTNKNKILDKGIVYPFQSTHINLTNATILRFLNGECKMGDYYVKGRSPSKIIVGQTIAKKQIMSSDYISLKDIPELRIHNLTGKNLLFNGHLVVPAKETIIYKGREQSGIQTGFLLVNNDNIFREFFIKHPITDIYFGIISENRLPIYTERYLI